MNNEFFDALDILERERHIPKQYMLEKVEAALVQAFKKEYGNNTNVRVLLDPVKQDVRVYQQKEVVEVVENPETEISLEEAKAMSKPETRKAMMQAQRDEQIAEAKKRQNDAQARIDAAKNNK
jgi:hypothetical protein